MLEVHRVLLRDEIRTNAYRDAISRVVTPESVVLDLGTGSGILSFLACEAGARRVFAIEETHSADLAMFLARELGYDDRVTVIHRRSSEVELPERASVLVTETLGAFAFEERILSSVIDARKRLLVPNAAIIPQHVELFVVPVEVPLLFDRHIGWWRQRPYGLDLSAVSAFASNVLYVSDIEAKAFLSAPARVISCAMATVESAEVAGFVHFEAGRSGVIHGFAGWFRATLTAEIVLSNEEPGTNWNHVFLPLETPQRIERGDPIEVRIETSDGRAWRWGGRIGATTFDQLTPLAMPPCRA